MLTWSFVRRTAASRQLFSTWRCSSSLPPLSRGPSEEARNHGGSRGGHGCPGMLPPLQRTERRSHNITWSRNFSSEGPKKDEEAKKRAVESLKPITNSNGQSEKKPSAPKGEHKAPSPGSADASSAPPKGEDQQGGERAADVEAGPHYCESDKEDEEMQRSYDGFWPRFHVFKDMLFMEPSEREAALKRIIKTTSKVYGASGVYAMPIKIHIDLQNPLLQKYGFRPEEFLEGAEVAFKTICASVDPKATSDEEAEDLYKAVLAPGVSKYFAEMREQVREQQRLSEEPTEKKQDKSVGSEKSKTAAYTTSQDIRLRAFFIESVKTQIVPRKHNAEDLPSDTKPKPSFLASLFSKPSPAAAEASPGEGAGPGAPSLVDAAVSSPHDVLKGYLPGCVVARVRVQFVYEKASWGPSELAVVGWDFMGCLSNQMDLDWKIAYTDPLFL